MEATYKDGFSFNLAPIEHERALKLASLYEDRVDFEQALLTDSLAACELTAAEAATITAVLRFARAQHYGTRLVDRYYVAHPIRVARFMARWLPGQSTRAAESVIAALLHNVFEKSVFTETELAERHGAWVSKIVAALTPDRTSLGTPGGVDAYYDRLSRLPKEGQALKVLDKFDNLLAICFKDDAGIREKYVREIEGHVLPLCDRAIPALSGYLRDLVADTRAIGYVPPTISQTSTPPREVPANDFPDSGSNRDAPTDNAA